MFDQFFYDLEEKKNFFSFFFPFDQSAVEDQNYDYGKRVHVKSVTKELA